MLNNIKDRQKDAQACNSQIQDGEFLSEPPSVCEIKKSLTIKRRRSQCRRYLNYLWTYSEVERSIRKRES